MRGEQNENADAGLHVEKRMISEVGFSCESFANEMFVIRIAKRQK